MCNFSNKILFCLQLAVIRCPVCADLVISREKSLFLVVKNLCHKHEIIYWRNNVITNRKSVQIIASMPVLMFISQMEGFLWLFKLEFVWKKKHQALPPGHARFNGFSINVNSNYRSWHISLAVYWPKKTCYGNSDFYQAFHFCIIA